MKKASLIALALVLAIATMLSACGNNAGTVSDGDVEKITFVMFAYGETPDKDLVMEAVNKITEEKIGVVCDLQFYDLSTYEEQIGLMLTGGEDCDIVMIPDTVGAMVSQGQLMPIDELLEEYGKDIKDVCGQFLNFAPIEGKNYGIPFYAGYVYYNALVFRKDICDKYNIDVSNIKSYKDLEAVYEQVKANEPDMICLAPGYDTILSGGHDVDPAMIHDFVYLGDNIGVLMNGEGYNVVDLYESEGYADACRTMRDWYNKGYIMKDAANTSEVGSLLYYEGNVFSYFTSQSTLELASANGQPVVHTGISQACNYETYVLAMNDPLVLADSMACGIASTSKHAEAAMKWLNLLYTDADVLNQLYYGKEGYHWQYDDKGFAEYCEGIDPTNSGWGTAFCWSLGNNSISCVFSSLSDDIDANKKQAALNDNAKLSPAYGFVFDPEPVSTEYAAVNNVIGKYNLSLESGSVDPDEYLPKFIEELKAAGIDAIIAEKQAQLDKWVEDNGK